MQLEQRITHMRKLLMKMYKSCSQLEQRLTGKKGKFTMKAYELKTLNKHYKGLIKKQVLGNHSNHKIIKKSTPMAI